MADWLLLGGYVLAGILVAAAFWFIVGERIPALVIVTVFAFWPIALVAGSIVLLMDLELPPSPLPEIRARRAAIGREKARIRALQKEAELRRLKKARSDLERELQAP